jgi:tRNA splicing endonuclease
MIANLFGVGEEAKKTQTSLEDLEEITQDRIDSETDIRLALARTAVEYRAIQVEIMNTVLQKHNLLRVTHDEIRQNLILAKAERDAIRGRAAEMARAAGSARGAAEAGAIFAETGTGQAKVDAQTQALIESTALLEKSTTRLNGARLRIIQSDKSAARAAQDSARAAREQNKELSELEEKLKSLTEKYAPQTGALEVARIAYERGAITLAQYNNELSEYLGLTDRQMKLQTLKPEDFSEITQAIGDVKPVEALDEAIKKATESLEAKKQAVESIGQAVANGFKGMITGAQSFGDAMKGIINSVIDELFRLFVVQQIVGFVKNTIGGAFGLPDGRALGGSVTANTPYIVGEKGPELFMPGKSGTVIPTQNTRGMGAGGSVINVSVDARGSTDPEAVRQQVERGILEAAPSIVAAAEQRTISTLRRPRLAGVL